MLLSKIPAWVPLVFFGLLALGLLQSRTRVVRPSVVGGGALLMFALSLQGVVTAFGASPLPLLCWAGGVALAAHLASRRPDSAGLVRVGERVRVPGRWWPLALMMGLFGAKFALGAATGLGLEVVHDPALAAAASGLFGLMSGCFVARAWAVARLAAFKAPDFARFTP
jgi:hypothetical protein